MSELNSEKDNTIDVTNLTEEFRGIAPLIYRYGEAKANAEHAYDLSKAELDELKAQLYMEIKSSGEKVTEKHVEAIIDHNDRVKAAVRKTLELKRDLETIKSYTESLRAKKDMLIQLGADSRKE